MSDRKDEWVCPGCLQRVQPSDVRRHASECPYVDGAGEPLGYALFADNANMLGFYDTKQEADRELDALVGLNAASPDELSVIPWFRAVEKKQKQRAALRLLTWLSERMPGGYR